MALFALTGHYTAPGLRALATGSMQAVEAALTSTAEALGGQLVRLFFVSGTLSVTAIVDLPHGPGLAALAIALLSSGMVEPGAEVVRLLSFDDVDAAFAACRAKRVLPPK